MEYSRSNGPTRIQWMVLQIVQCKLNLEHKIPTKGEGLSALVVKDVILTQNNLQRREWPSLNICSLCASSNKTVTHIMTRCGYSDLVWAQCAQQFGFIVNSPPIHNIWDRIYSSRNRRKLHSIVIVAVYQNIWKERNRRIFTDIASSCDCGVL